MITIQNIKDEYYVKLAQGLIKRQNLETYIKENYIQLYNDKLEFIGYEKR